MRECFEEMWCLGSTWVTLWLVTLWHWPTTMPQVSFFFLFHNIFFVSLYTCDIVVAQCYQCHPSIILWCFEGIQIFWCEFHCLDNNLKNFQNDGNLWSILFKLNLKNLKWHLKIKNFKKFRCYDFSNFAFWFSKFSIWPQ